MADGMKAEGKAIEKGEYIIGIAIILAALLVSGTVFMGMGSITEAIGKVKLNVTTVSGTPQAQAPEKNVTEPAAIAKVSVDLSNVQFQGKSDAKVVMVEYSDFECPYCSRVLPAIAQVQSAYPDMKFVFKQFPLSFHPNAEKAAEAALCAADQGKFWELHAKMYADQSAITVADIKKYAAGLGLDTAKFNACLDGNGKAAQVAAEEQEGANAGIRGTPGFVVFSKSVKSDALAAKLAPIAANLQALGVDAAVIEVNGAGYGISFAGALPYSNFQEVMNAFN